MKHWNQYRDQTAILFEIFGKKYKSNNCIYSFLPWITGISEISFALFVFIQGTLDSELSSNNYGMAKNFVIKDETGTLRYII